MKTRMHHYFVWSLWFSAAFIMLLVFPVTGLSGQDLGAEVLDLDRAVEIARERNPGLKVSRLEIARSEAGIDIARGRFLPNISAAGGYTRNIKKPVIFLPPGNPFGDVLEIGSDNSYLGTLSAGIPVYNPVLHAALGAARAERELAGEEHRASQIELTYFVQRAFYDALLARESRDVMQLSFSNAVENLERISRLHEQGMVAEFDLVRAQVQTDNLRPSVLQAENGYVMAANYLKALIGLEEADEIELLGKLDELAARMMNGFMIMDASRSLNQNTDLVRLELQMKLLSQQARSVRATAMPSLLMLGNYNFQTESNTFNFSDYNWVKTFAAGLRFSIPVFSGFTVKNQVKQVDILGQQLQLQKDYLRETLGIQLDNVLNTLTVSAEKSNTAQGTILMAERAYDISKVRYGTGQGTLLEMNDSELALTQARFNFLQANYEILVAKAEYDKFTGQHEL